MKKKVGIIVGSLRKNSFNRKIAKALVELAPDSLDMHWIEIEHLSLYNEDMDSNPPDSWLGFRKKIKSMDGLIFVTPEYNRSIPGGLKNAIDIGSRPYGDSSWTGKPAAIISGSPGGIGGFGANHHLRQCMVFLDVPCMQQPEAYIGNMYGLFDKNDQLTMDETRAFFTKIMKSYAKWLENNAP